MPDSQSKVHIKAVGTILNDIAPTIDCIFATRLEETRWFPLLEWRATQPGFNISICHRRCMLRVASLLRRLLGTVVIGGDYRERLAFPDFHTTPYSSMELVSFGEIRRLLMTTALLFLNGI